jgi:hypothetical protein
MPAKPWQESPEVSTDDLLRMAEDRLQYPRFIDLGTVPYPNTVREEPRQMKDITAIATVRRVPTALSLGEGEK